ncbi:MAG: hypothetical protein ABWY18_10415, partial [Tardiphaga sp.]
MLRLSRFAALVATAFLAAGPWAAAQAQSASTLAFQNTVKGPPPGWTGPVFKLSRDYPASAPSQCPECTWLTLDVNFNPEFPPSPDNPWTSGKWADYLKRIIDYVKVGQDPQLGNTPGFQAKVGGKTRWFNVPWMAYDPTVGREFVHGTTNERTAYLPDLINPVNKKLRSAQTAHGVNFLAGTTQACQNQYKAGFETWAVGYYNAWGGAAFGKAIPASGVPQTVDYLGTQMPAGLPFPTGTVVVKFLTTNAPPECVPYLRGSPEWQIDRHVLDEAKDKYTCERKVQISRIVQVDVAVTDPRSPTGWVYGTFAYSADQPGTTFWDHLLPLGIQYGSDPWTFPAVPQAESIKAQQSVLNPGVNIYQHFGCSQRLAGPVDNSQSSCMSCHGSAFAAPKGAVSNMGVNVPPSFGFSGMCTQYSSLNAAYFNNIIAPQKFSGGNYSDAIPLDTSLQLEVAYQQYGQFNTFKAP